MLEVTLRLPDKNTAKKEETIGPYINRAVLTLSPNHNLYDACRLMYQNRIGCVVIVKNSKPIGIISESTIVKQVAYGLNLQTELSKVMSTRIITTDPDKSIADALELMHRHHIRRLPVMENGSLIGIITQTDLLEASRRSINAFKTSHAHLSEIASRDELTGVYNRRYFREVFQDELARARRYGGLLSLLLLDIDHFKEINDHYGHSVGDKVLQQIAIIIKNNVRQIDTVTRYGGDEFAVLLPGIGTRASYLFAERLRNTVENYSFSMGGKNIKLTISGGICKWTKVLDGIPAMINEADTYLYKAKRSGRNRICVST